MREELEQLIREEIAARPTEFGWNGGSYLALRSKLASACELGDYGAVAGYRFSLRAVLSDLPAIPQKGELLTVGSEVYRILDPVEVDSLDATVLLHLGGRAE